MQSYYHTVMENISKTMNTRFQSLLFGFNMRSRDPVCLCFVIQKVHEGDASLKQLGLQEYKILHLAEACDIKNASVSQCPKYLNLSPNSPDYGFSMNSSSAATSTSNLVPKESKGSDALMQRPHIVVPTVIAIASAVFVSGFPTGLLSVFYMET